MTRTVTTTSEVRPDHTLTVTLPEDVPPGRVRVTVTVEPVEAERKLSARELAHSDFAGDWAQRDDLPETPDEFADWRSRRWERPTE
jgi:hypothetical protein